MANKKSAEKRARQNTAQRARNKSYVSGMRSKLKNLVLTQGVKALGEIQSLLDKAAQHGYLNKKTAARKLSRVTSALKKQAAK